MLANNGDDLDFNVLFKRKQGTVILYPLYSIGNQLTDYLSTRLLKIVQF